VLHDTTIVSFNGEREGLGRIYQSGGIRGFFVHASLAVTTERAPLRVLRAETWTRTSPPRKNPNRRKLRTNPKRDQKGRRARSAAHL
jgi:hypothetical protein